MIETVRIKAFTFSPRDDEAEGALVSAWEKQTVIRHQIDLSACTGSRCSLGTPLTFAKLASAAGELWRLSQSSSLKETQAHQPRAADQISLRAVQGCLHKAERQKSGPASMGASQSSRAMLIIQWSRKCELPNRLSHDVLGQEGRLSLQMEA
jgi:hypothetical protein